jgi:predicted amino acid-binding ACT domain protein
MSNEFSVEALVAMGTGLVSNKTNKVTASIEGYDGYDDEIYAAVTRSEESLKFLDTYELMENKKTSDKLKMLKKINANYNSKTIGNAVAANSIESYVQSLEEDAAADTGTTDAGKTDGKAGENPAKNEKKKGILKTIINAIKSFIKKIRDFIQTVIRRIKTFFIKLFTKGDVELVKENPYGKDEQVYCFDTIDFSGAKKLLGIMQKFDVKVSEKDADNISQRTVANTEKKVKKFPTEEDEILNTVYGIRKLPSEQAWKKANPKVIKRISEDLPKVLEEFNKILAKGDATIAKIEQGVNSGKFKYEIVQNGETHTGTAEEVTTQVRNYLASVQKIVTIGNKMCSEAAKLIVKKGTAAPASEGEKPANENKQ